MDTPTADSDGARMMGLQVKLKMLGTTQGHEDIDGDQGDKLGQNENTRLMCQ